MLKFNDEWRYKSPGPISQNVDNEFSQLIKKIAKGEQNVLEHFKKYFSAASGQSSSRSSNADWAASDLDSYMSYAASNAPLFIEAFCEAWKSLAENLPKINLPYINEILRKYDTRYQIDGDNLTYDGPHVTSSPEVPKSFLEHAKDTIYSSLNEGDKLLSEGRHRQAVQEILWLLETVVTAFDGVQIDGKQIDGKYFNEIITKLRKSDANTTFKQVIDWVTKLHGYLSAPAGGGIRHGLHLEDGDLTTANEARLYYNLIKSYVSYFMEEYEELQNSRNDKSDTVY